MKQLFNNLVSVLDLQKRSAGVALESVAELLIAYVYKDYSAALSGGFDILGEGQRAASRGDNQVLALAELDARLALQSAELRLAALGENPGYGFARFFLYLFVGIYKFSACFF